MRDFGDAKLMLPMKILTLVKVFKYIFAIKYEKKTKKDKRIILKLFFFIVYLTVSYTFNSHEMPRFRILYIHIVVNLKQ